jgi:hypothetical protein
MIMLYRAILLWAIFLLVSCAPQVELEPAAPEGGLGPPALAPVEQATGEADEKEGDVAEPVFPVTVDLRDLTPVTPAARELIVQPSPGVPDPLRQLVEEAIRDLSAQLNVEREDIVVEEALAVDWRDSSVGCPEPGMGYLTVITPGYWIVLKVGSEAYYYHADTRGRLVHCPQEWSTPPPGWSQPSPPLVIQPKPGAPDTMEKLLDLIKQDLSRRIGANRDQINVVESQRVQWPDSSLGCPEPDMAYLMVITPGYRIVLEAGGQEHYYHTNDNDYFVYCPESQPPPALDE